MNGPFKAYLTSAATKVDLDQGGREGRFYLRIVAEPRWTGFQYQRPILVRATDDRGRIYAPKNGPASMTNWQTSPGNLIEFDDDWAAIKVVDLAAEATSMAELTVEVPIRLVHTRRECRLAVDQRGRRSSVTDGGRVFTLKDCDRDGPRLSFTVTIESEHQASWGAYKFHLAQGGRKISDVFPRTTTSRSSGSGFFTEFELMASTVPAGDSGESRQLVVSYPDRTTEKRIRFTFQDVALP